MDTHTSSKLLRDVTESQARWRAEGKYREEEIQMLTRRQATWKEMIGECVKAFQKGDAMEDIFRFADLLIEGASYRENLEERQNLTDSLIFAQDMCMAVNERRLGRNPKALQPVDMEKVKRTTLQTLELPGLGQLLGILNNGDSITEEAPPEHAVRIVSACESVPNVRIGEFDSMLGENSLLHARLKKERVSQDPLQVEEEIRKSPSWRRMIKITLDAAKAGDELPNLLGFAEIMMTRSPHRRNFSEEENIRHATALTQDICVALSEEKTQSTVTLENLRQKVRRTLELVPLGKFLGIEKSGEK